MSHEAYPALTQSVLKVLASVGPDRGGSRVVPLHKLDDPLAVATGRPQSQAKVISLFTVKINF